LPVLFDRAGGRIDDRLGIYIVGADIARAPTLRRFFWALVVTAILTMTAALSYGELAAMMPKAGGSTFICANRWGLCGISLRLDAFPGHSDGNNRRCRRGLRQVLGVFFSRRLHDIGSGTSLMYRASGGTDGAGTWRSASTRRI